MITVCSWARAGLTVIAMGLAGVAWAQDEAPAFDDRDLERLASPELGTFASEQEFARYLREVDRIRRKRYEPRRSWRSGIAEPASPEFVVAQAEIAGPECTDPEFCPVEDAATAVVVTGSRATTPTITNVQVAGVDEGDIVKQIGEYLLVLQDGRIFALHYPTMRLSDRIDAYRRDEDGDPIGADWYDEMLVQGDQVIVTAYSYEDQASEISVFRLDGATGRLKRRGVFLITSDDYYDVDNYATRIIGDQLVIHTSYEAEQVADRSRRPVVRRWSLEDAYDDAVRHGRQLFDARDIHRPLFAVEEPTIHTISICPLGEVAQRGLECRSTAFVGTEYAEMFVSPEAIYLWLPALGENDVEDFECRALDGRSPASLVPPAVIVRVPVGRGEPTVMGMRGIPFDQFSMDEHRNRFRALVDWGRHYCQRAGDELAQVALVDVPRSAFGSTYRKARDSLFTPLPSPGTRVVDNRFAGDWLVYGGRDSYSGRPWYRNEDEAIPQPSAVAVPLRDPTSPVMIGQPHNVIRIERVGDDMIVNGYSALGGLDVSYVDLGETARVASTLRLDNRFESEGRSHAFNATVAPDGSGVLGVPTISRVRDAGRYWWWSAPSDLNYLTFDSQGSLSDAGHLPGKTEDETETAEGYECEVSCIDWYGNARPFFLGGKVFGLIATQLVEAELVDGKVTERRRVDLTGPISPTR